MKECMETDRPLVSIVMATYNPRMDWLKEQLISLENQTYRPLELLILDDCSTEVELDKIRRCVADCIGSIPYQIMQNEVNLGSTKTFEKLTMLAGGEYIAYCDQDDVWHEDKMEQYIDAFSNSEANIVFSDMNIIDADGSMIANSITKIRKHHKFQSGEGLSKTLLFRNFVTGCAMMIKSDQAKKAMPFCPYMVHDHWLALHSSINGQLCFLNRPMVDYRIHDRNQTLILAGVANKRSYLDIRIEKPLKKLFWLEKRFGENIELIKTIEHAIEWMLARRDNLVRKGSSMHIMWKYRKFNCAVTLFEMAAAFMPERLFCFFILLGKKNLI